MALFLATCNAVSNCKFTREITSVKTMQLQDNVKIKKYVLPRY